ncbi:CBS domain-containing protein [Desulfoprunum benzoelyticum]|uniref:CBS domain-containing protein n=1 Tax=Desulfoprunum benzoelyticum TaxID=1506996 RepID=A0A840UU48_9BACT|nr:CBS domain-containing protein [Desulfoprunum benzoelyticum]MBM9529516.1 CBS domain-containing protein [Desulfoprunum benzoelyticum]
MSTEIQTVRDIMLPLSGFPCMKESGTVQEAIRQLRSFCPLGSTGPCGFSELMVVDDQGGLIGRVTQQGILRVLFSTLLDPIDIKPFEGRTAEYSDLTTLLNGVLINEGVNHLNASLTKVIETRIRVLPASTDLIHAMSVMVISRETVLPVEENGRLVGVIQLAEVFGALGDRLIAMNSK